jgi:methyl-accepting chemotaxis protein
MVYCQVNFLLASALPDMIGSHWSIVLAVGLLFFAVQITLCVRFFRWLGKYVKTLTALSDDVEKGGDGRRNIGPLAAQFPWLKWVNSNFPAGTTTPGNYTREDVLHELDTRIASSSDYLLLQRMGVMAPLLGVILTVLGFPFIQLPETEDPSLDQMLDVVTPLVAGVGTGAVLALINQWLLHIAGGRAETMRMIGRTWFDSAIWYSVGLDTQAATVKAIAAIERMAKSVSESADHQSENAHRLVESTSAIRHAAAEFREIVQVFGTDIKDLPETLRNVRDATAASAQALNALIPVGQRAVAGLDVSVSAFRTSIEQDFIPSASRHRESIDSLTALNVSALGDSSSRIQEAAKAVTEGTVLFSKVMSEQSEFAELMNPIQQTLHEAIDRLSKSGAQLEATVDAEVTPSQRAFSEAAASFTASASQLAHFIHSGVEPATKRLAELHVTLAGLEKTAKAMQEFGQAGGNVERITKSLAEAADVADAIAALPAQISEVLAQHTNGHAEAAGSSGKLMGWLRGRAVE